MARQFQVLVDGEWLPLDNPPPAYADPDHALKGGGWTATYGQVTHPRHGEVWIVLRSFPVRVAEVE